VHSHKRVVVCYLGTWATYRPGAGTYDLDKHFQPDLCTHLIYSFAGLDNVTNEIKPLDPYLDLTENYGRGWYKKSTALKQKYPHLNILLAIGGWNEGSEKYSAMASDQKTRKIFTKSALDTVRKYGFDGLDMDWEYPARRNGKPEDKKNFILLLQELRQAFNQYDLMLTAAVGATKEIAETSYDLPELNRLLDQIHLMCYDYHGTWDKRTNHNAPFSSIKDSVNYYLENGIDANKLVLGLPMYGRTFLINSTTPGDGLREVAEEKGFQGDFTREDGFAGYNEICNIYISSRGEWKIYFDGFDGQAPYMRNGAKWISFDNPYSLRKKVQFANSKKLKGAMVWSIDTDDFLGICDDKSYPLLRAINYELMQDTPKKKPSSTASLISVVSTSMILFGLLICRILVN